MRPRRISLHLQQQNWLAVLLDLLVVVAGIFIALQVSQWHNQGEERVQRVYLLEKLASDITLTLQDYKDYKQHYAADIANYERLITILTEQPAAENTSSAFFSAYNAIFSLPTASFNSPTFDYIVEAGKLNYLGNSQTQSKFLDVHA